MSDPDWDLSVYNRIRWYKVGYGTTAPTPPRGP